MEARFVYGDPVMVDHTPDADVDAGEVVCTTKTPRIAHLPIAAGEKGALACGGGVYEVNCLDALGLPEDQEVFWDNVSNGVTGDITTGGYRFGFTVEEAAGLGKVKVRHAPDQGA